MYRSLFPRNVFAELERLQRDLQGTVDPSPGIRGLARGGFPTLNVGGTPGSVEVCAFAPGMDPATIEVHLDRGVLTISGERHAALTGSDDKQTLHVNERFAGRFRRVVNLPDDIDPGAVDASYTDGVLRISVQRRGAALPRRIDIQ